MEYMTRPTRSDESIGSKARQARPDACGAAPLDPGRDLRSRCDLGRSGLRRRGRWRGWRRRWLHCGS